MLPSNGQRTVIAGLQPEVVVPCCGRERRRVLAGKNARTKKMEQTTTSYTDQEMSSCIDLSTLFSTWIGPEKLFLSMGNFGRMQRAGGDSRPVQLQARPGPASAPVSSAPPRWLRAVTCSRGSRLCYSLFRLGFLERCLA